MSQNIKRNWKVIYSNYAGPEKKAAELINKEMGALTVRDAGEYTLHVLAYEHVKKAVLDKNAVVIGQYSENEIIRKYIAESEIPENGYVVKVMDNPENAELKLVLITANDAVNVFYGAVDFVDDYFSKAAPERSYLNFTKEIFCGKLPDYYSAVAPTAKVRSIFTWGHPINDYVHYIDTAARLRFNKLLVWNEYLPVNAKEFCDYAHEYGIKVIWGYAWGWSRNCKNIDMESLDKLRSELVEQYETEYADSGADGIYFQSFTELTDTHIGGKLIAEVVTDFVNKTCSDLLERHPDLSIEFGLHATSVKEHLDYIAKVDKRVSIVWEDCGSFPYGYRPYVTDEAEYIQTEEFTKEILTMRNGCLEGLLYKGMVIMDWVGDHFAHQSGPYIIGKASEAVKSGDIEVVKPIWKNFQSAWMQNGEYAYKMTKHIHSISGTDVNVGVAAQLAGGAWFPYALCAEIIWNCNRPYDEIFERVTKLRYLTLV